jgi:molybdenum cofactor cytidylyltransferase
MGQPKLILPLGNESVISHVIRALHDGGADRVIVVLPPQGSLGASQLAEEARRAGAEMAPLESATEDMRESISWGLAWLARGRPPDAVLLAPGDSPGISAALVARVIARGRSEGSSIIIPTHAGRGGHPVLIPWTLAREIPALPEGVGVNALMARNPGSVVKLEVDDAGAIADLDTPDDYRRWIAEP